MIDLATLKQALDAATPEHLAAIDRNLEARMDLDEKHDRWLMARRAYDDASYRAKVIERQAESHALLDQLTAEAQDMGLEP